jgi:NAD(P)H-dependent FMN reductase
VTKIGIILGSTRPGRKSSAVADWVQEIAAEHSGGAQFELVDIVDFGLPHFDEEIPPAAGQYAKAHTKIWANKIAEFDGYIFVTPEYNHSLPGALKNAIDFVHAEWNNKAAGFVGYGSVGGARAVEHLRQIMAELQVAGVRTAVLLSLFTDFENFTTFTPAEFQRESVTAMLDQLIPWAEAFKPLRDNIAKAA